MRSLRFRDGPQEANAYWLSMQNIIGIKRPDAIRELSDDRRVNLPWISIIEPPDGPLFRRCVEGPQGNCTIRPVWQREEVIFQVSESAKNFLCSRCARKRGPLSASGKAFIQAPMVYVPIADDEIKVYRHLLNWHVGLRMKLEKNGAIS